MAGRKRVSYGLRGKCYARDICHFCLCDPTTWPAISMIWETSGLAMRQPLCESPAGVGRVSSGAVEVRGWYHFPCC